MAPAPAAAAAEISPPDLTVYVTDLGTEQRDCQIDADLYVPAGVSAADPGPALLVTNGFGGDKTEQARAGSGLRRARLRDAFPAPASGSSTATSARSPWTTSTTRARSQPAAALLGGDPSTRATLAAS